MDITILTIAAWQAIQPLLPLIVTKGAEELGKRAVGEIWETVKGKFEGKPAAKEALNDLLTSPEDADLQAAFRVQLKKLLAEDTAFAAQLDGLLKAAGAQYHAALQGDGAIAQGDGATAVGKGGVYVGGSARNTTIITEDGNKVDR